MATEQATEQMIAFMLFVIVAAITPGPSNLILMSTGSTVGILRGLPCVFGAAASMGMLMFLVAFGLGSLVLESPLLLQGIRLGGIGFLLWLSWKIITAGRTELAGSPKVVGFWQAAAFQWINPKSWLVSTSAAATYIQTGTGSALAQSLTFGLLFILVAFPCFFIWLAFGATIQRLLHTPQAVRIFNVVMGALLAGSILLFLW